MTQAALRESGAAPSILVAEDDLATRSLLRATLERADYRVRDVEDGVAALEAIRSQLPDVVLLDVGTQVRASLPGSSPSDQVVTAS